MSYNGYPNRDTWLVALWLTNDQRNYNMMRRNKKQLRGKEINVTTTK